MLTVAEVEVFEERRCRCSRLSMCHGFDQAVYGAFLLTVLTAFQLRIYCSRQRVLDIVSASSRVVKCLNMPSKRLTCTDAISKLA